MTIRTIAAVCLIAVLVFDVWANTADAQLRDRSLPSQNYYVGFADFYSADYGDALKHFTRGSNSAFKIGTNERFMDSACYWTMAGECHYHMGNYPEALAYYEQALQLLVTYAKGDWAQRIDPQPGSVQPSSSAVQRAGITWYNSARGSAIAKVPSSFSMFFGRLDANRAFVEGGVVQSPEIRPVDHREIMRCAALAIHRRDSIRGVTTQIDPFTSTLVSGLSKLPIEKPIIGKWNLMLIGLANMSAGKYERAAAQISSALQFSSGLDHQLTPIGLLVLAKIALKQGELETAAQLALESSYAAGIFGQYDLVEEALRLGTTIHLSQSRSVYPPLIPAIQWSARKKARTLQTSLIIRLADCFVESDNVEQATETLSQTKRSMSGTDLSRSIYAARIRYLSAALTFMNSQDGYPELKRALQQFQSGSKWLFQLGLINQALAAGSISQRQAELIYERLLIDPAENEWKFSPMETMAYLSTSHTGSMEQWFEILLARKHHEQAIEVAELVRRHRFFASLPMGGRLLSLRWVATAPEKLLSATAVKQREEIDSRYPELRQSVNRVAEIERELRAMPLQPPDDSDEQRKQKELFVEQLKHANYQESLFASLALRRQPADFVFPAAVKFSNISKGLKAKQIVVSSLETSSGYHQYVMTQQTRRYLGVVRTRDMRRAVAKLYKSLGITDANGAIEADILNAAEWKPDAAELKKLIFENFHDDQWENVDELVVVPDGVLWYVPFEILQTGADQSEWEDLNKAVKIRYLPVVSFASDARRDPNTDARVAVVTGKLHAKAIPELSDNSFEKLSDTITNAVKYSGPVKIPSNLLGTVIDTLVVWTDIKLETRGGPYSLRPFQLDTGRVGSTLEGWIGAPWRGPEKVVIPMYSTAAAAGIKSRSNGQELFLTTCGLLAAGVKSILISRWRVGGENSLDLSREFTIRSRQMSTPLALYESIEVARNQELNLANEIRIKPSRKRVDPFKAEHPFFWAGNLLVDLNGYESNDAPAGDLTQTDDDTKPDEMPDDVMVNDDNPDSDQTDQTDKKTDDPASALDSDKGSSQKKSGSNKNRFP